MFGWSLSAPPSVSDAASLRRAHSPSCVAFAGALETAGSAHRLRSRCGGALSRSTGWPCYAPPSDWSTDFVLRRSAVTLLPAPYWDRRLSALFSGAHSAQRLRAHGVLAMASSLRFVLRRWLGRAPLLSFGGGFSTSSFGMWSSRRCRRGELTLGWCVPAPREDFTTGWWRQASAVRYGLARRLPRGGHDLTSASWSTFTDLIPFHALFETIQLSCLLLVTFSSHGSERSPGRPRLLLEQVYPAAHLKPAIGNFETVGDVLITFASSLAEIYLTRVSRSSLIRQTALRILRQA